MTLFYLASGQVSDLKVSRNYENILFTTGQSHSLEIGIVSAALGEALGSKVLSSSSAGAELEMDFFSCSVDGEIISGRLYKVEFKNGQQIDFAVKVEFGQRDIQAVRDPLRRLVWTLPYRTKGHLAQRKSNVEGSFATSACFGVLMFLLVFFSDFEYGESPFDWGISAAGLGFLLMLVVSYRVCRKVFRNSGEATEAFKALASLTLPTLIYQGGIGKRKGVMQRKPARAKPKTDHGVFAIMRPIWKIPPSQPPLRKHKHAPNTRR